MMVKPGKYRKVREKRLLKRWLPKEVKFRSKRAKAERIETMLPGLLESFAIEDWLELPEVVEEIKTIEEIIIQEPKRRGRRKKEELVELVEELEAELEAEEEIDNEPKDMAESEEEPVIASEEGPVGEEPQLEEKYAMFGAHDD